MFMFNLKLEYNMMKCGYYFFILAKYEYVQ